MWAGKENYMPTIPIFPLGLVLLPGMALPLHIFEERYKLMVSECTAEDKSFGIVLFDGKAIQTAGCTARVIEVVHRYDDGRMDILTRGEQRFIVQALIEQKPYMEARVAYFDDDPEAGGEELAPLIETGVSRLRSLAAMGGSVDVEEVPGLWDARRLSFAIAALEEVTPKEKQRFLEMRSIGRRLRAGVAVLERLIERAQLTRQIQTIIGGNGRPPKGLLGKIAEPEE
jgi:Lon protease-like protein